jgi:hypothetical protein
MTRHLKRCKASLKLQKTSKTFLCYTAAGALPKLRVIPAFLRRWANASDVVRDAVRHMQEVEAERNERALLANFEARLPLAEREDIKRSVKRGINEIEAGCSSL